MPPTGLDPFKPYNPPSSAGNAPQSMLDPRSASMRSLLNIELNNSSMQPQPPNNVPSAYYPSTVANSGSKDIPPAAHMFNNKSPSSSQSSVTANLHQMLNNTMSMAYNANREQQHHQMHHQPQQQQHPNQPNAYGQNHQQTPSVSVATPTATVPEAKPKRVRKKKVPAAAAAAPKPTPDNIQTQMLQHQQQQQQQHHLQQLQQQQTSHQQHHAQATAAAQQGFQSYSHLKTNQPTSKVTEPNATSLKSAGNASTVTASVPSMLPGSAFNYGPSGAGLSALYGSADGTPNYMEDFRNTPNPYYIPPAHHRSTPDPNGGTGHADKSSSAAAAAAAAVAATSAAAAAGAPSSYHQFLSHAAASSRASPYGFMGPAPSLDPNTQMYQSAQLRQMMLGQGILGHGAPAPYGLSGYHPALGMHKSPYDPMGQMNRPPWYQ